MQKNATFRPGFLSEKINYAYGSVRYRLIFSVRQGNPRQNLFE